MQNNELKNEKQTEKFNNELNVSKLKKLYFFKNLVEDSYLFEKLENSFAVFNSINNNILYLFYTNKRRSLVSFDLISNKKINEIKKPHIWYISNIRHYADNINKRDLIIFNRIYQYFLA